MLAIIKNDEFAACTVAKFDWWLQNNAMNDKIQKLSEQAEEQQAKHRADQFGHIRQLLSAPGF